MYSILRKFGSVLTVVLGEWMIRKAVDIFSTTGSIDETTASAIELSIRSQALAAVVYQRRGISGLASLYDAGAISGVEFALYNVRDAAYRLPPSSDERIISFEDSLKGQALYDVSFQNDSIESNTTDPDNVRRMYTYLMASY